MSTVISGDTGVSQVQDLLDKVKNVDGLDSGLDADLVQGININIKNVDGVIKDFDDNELSVDADVKLDTDGVSIVKSDDSYIKNQCTAWVNFDGTDGTIRDSFNINSVTREDVGRYTLAFDVDMGNVNYIFTGATIDISSEDDDNLVCVGQRTDSIVKSVSSFYLQVCTYNNAHIDVDEVFVQVMGGK